MKHWFLLASVTFFGLLAYAQTPTTTDNAGTTALTGYTDINNIATKGNGLTGGPVCTTPATKYPGIETNWAKIDKARDANLKASCPGFFNTLDCAKYKDDACQSYAYRIRQDAAFNEKYANSVNFDPNMLCAGLAGEGMSRKASDPPRKTAYPSKLIKQKVTCSTGEGNPPFVGTLYYGEGSDPCTGQDSAFGAFKGYAPADTHNGDGADTFYYTYQTNPEFKKNFDANFKQMTGREFRVESQDSVVARLNNLPDGGSVPGSEMADFMYEPDTQRNEIAGRFSVPVDTMLSDPKMSLLNAKVNPNAPGDPGAGTYGSSEAQFIVTSNLWKLSQDRLDKTLDKLLVEYSASSDPSAASKISQIKRLQSEMKTDPRLRMFWDKVFYNAGQGGQSSGIGMLKTFLNNGALKNDDYIKTGKPPAGASCEIFVNASMAVTGYDSCKYTPANSNPGVTTSAQ